MLNPIVRREAQTSLRSWKAFLIITIYVVIIALISVAYINSALSGSYYSGFDPQSIVYLYAILSGMQFGYLFIIVPALTAGSISGERERQTLDILLTTKMSPFSIVLGKLISGMGTMLLTLVATMPVYAILFYYGGASVTHIISMTLFNIITSFFIGSVSIFFSTVYKKTMASLISTYFILGLFLFGTYVAYLIYVQFYMRGVTGVTIYNYDPYIYSFLSVNPGAGFFSVIDAQLGTDIFYDITMLWQNTDLLAVPMWIINPIASVVLGFMFLKLAAMKINPLNAKNQKLPKNKKKNKNQ